MWYEPVAFVFLRFLPAVNQWVPKWHGRRWGLNAAEQFWKHVMDVPHPSQLQMQPSAGSSSPRGRCCIWSCWLGICLSFLFKLCPHDQHSSFKGIKAQLHLLCYALLKQHGFETLLGWGGAYYILYYVCYTTYYCLNIWFPVYFYFLALL